MPGVAERAITGICRYDTTRERTSTAQHCNL